ncbi:hypothetical protein K5O51_003658 [Salmonella enterica subsp. enterica]|nr:hypothetical protein [Salmonella enterica subsp. enterica]
MAITVIGSALADAAAYVGSALVGIMIGVGIMEEDDESPTEDKKTRSKDKTNTDIDGGKDDAKNRIAKITATEELSQAKSRCKQCPADAGSPLVETAKTESINILYQIKITGNPSGPGWVQTWLFASVSFDGFQSSACLLQEAKGAYDQFFISDTQVVKWWSGIREITAQAIVQDAVVVATPPNELNWYFMEPMSYSFFSRLFISLGLSMRVFYVPF